MEEDNRQPLWGVIVSFVWAATGFFMLIAGIWKGAVAMAFLSHLQMMLACAVIIAQGRVGRK